MPTKMAINTFISLGSRCQIATQLQRNGIRSALFPFDWLVSDDVSGVYSAIEKDFWKFFFPDNLKVHFIGKPYVEDCVYHVVDSHSFSTIKSVKSKAEEIYQKYQRAAYRFRAALESQEPCLLLRKYGTAWQICALASLIEQKYPQARFMLIHLLDIERDDLKINNKRVRSYSIHYPPSFAQTDRRFDAEWKNLLHELKLLECQ